MATLLVMRHAKLLGIVFLWPFLFVPARRSSIVALVALGYWGAVYFVITKLMWHLS